MQSIAGLSFALCILMQPAEKAAQPQHVKAYLTRCAELKAEQIKAEQTEIQVLTDGFFRDKDKLLAAARLELKKLQDSSAPLAALPLPPKKDDVGVFEPPSKTGPRQGKSVDVLEVVDEDDAIIRAWFVPEGSPDEVTFADLWLHGIPTGDFTAKMPVSLPQVFHVKGNQLIDTTCGKRSFPLLEPIEVGR